MDPTAIGGFAQILSSGGLLVGFIIVIYTGVKKMWVFGWIHDAIVEFYKAQIAAMEKRHAEELAAMQARHNDEMAAERQRTQEWKGMAINGIDTARQATNVAGAVVGGATASRG